VLQFGARTLVMGIVNVTPDSFSDGGRHFAPEAAVAHARLLVDQGADILDLGAESTRPGANPVPVHEEIDRLRPVLARLTSTTRVPISVDTTKPEVAEMALEAGAAMINDVSMLRHGDDMARLTAAHNAALILMHSRGTPATMGTLTDYPAGVTRGVMDELSAVLARACEAGMPAQALLVDPGIGFAKTAAQSLEVLAHLHAFTALDRPLVVGVSRKSFIGHVLERPVDGRLEGSLAAEAAAALGGAHVLRTHDVAACRQVADLLDALRGAGPAGETA
jgi:dihydropteroate synthase